jgi:hypothetical protein
MSVFGQKRESLGSFGTVMAENGQKYELQQHIFPERIYFSKKNRETRTTKINSVFRLLPVRRAF